MKRGAAIALGAVALLLLAGTAEASIITSKGPKRPHVSTYEGDAASWANARYRLARDYFADFWKDALDEDGQKAAALSALAHWSLETGSGAGEGNFNVGNIHAVGSQPWYRGPDVSVKGKRYQTSFASYDSLADGVRAYFDLLERHYASCLQKLAASPTAPDWFRCLGENGYYAKTMKGKDNIGPAAAGWAARRALLAQYATEGDTDT